MMRILGLDPGLSGAWAVLDDLGYLLACGDLPVAGDGAKRMLSAPLVAEIIRRFRPAQAIVERVNAMPGQGVASMFRFGRSVGVAEGVLGALAIPVMYVSPSVWKKHFGLPAEKESARQLAIETWPANAAIHFARKRDHGRAEACLLALWGVRAAISAGGADAGT